IWNFYKVANYEKKIMIAAVTALPLGSNCWESLGELQSEQQQPRILRSASSSPLLHREQISTHSPLCGLASAILLMVACPSFPIDLPPRNDNTHGTCRHSLIRNAV